MILLPISFHYRTNLIPCYIRCRRSENPPDTVDRSAAVRAAGVDAAPARMPAAGTRTGPATGPAGMDDTARGCGCDCGCSYGRTRAGEGCQCLTS